MHCPYREGEYCLCPTQEFTGKRSLYCGCIFLVILVRAGEIGKIIVTLLIKADSMACPQSGSTNAVLYPKGS